MMCLLNSKIQGGLSDYPKKILAGLAIYSYFAQMEGWLHHERNGKIPLHVNKTLKKNNMSVQSAEEEMGYQAA